MDIVVNRNYDEIDLKGFLSRIEILRNSVKTGIRKIMPIIIYKNIEKRTYNQILNLNILNFDLGSIFGSNIYKIIDNLQVIKNNDSQNNSIENIENSLLLIENSGQEENLSNIKGDFFEFIIKHLLGPRFYVSILKSTLKALINICSFEIQLSPIG